MKMPFYLLIPFIIFAVFGKRIVCIVICMRCVYTIQNEREGALLLLLPLRSDFLLFVVVVAAVVVVVIDVAG